jgi:ribose 5-phosphate isomerase A
LEKSGPLKTDQGFYIVDAPFPTALEAGLVDALAKKIRDITGVLEVGLFCGFDGIEAELNEEAKGRGQKPVAVYFGMEDGSVKLRVRKGGVPGLELE